MKEERLLGYDPPSSQSKNPRAPRGQSQKQEILDLYPRVQRVGLGREGSGEVAKVPPTSDAENAFQAQKLRSLRLLEEHPRPGVDFRSRVFLRARVRRDRPLNGGGASGAVRWLGEFG